MDRRAANRRCQGRELCTSFRSMRGRRTQYKSVSCPGWGRAWSEEMEACERRSSLRIIATDKINIIKCQTLQGTGVCAGSAGRLQALRGSSQALPTEELDFVLQAIFCSTGCRLIRSKTSSWENLWSVFQGSGIAYHYIYLRSSTLFYLGHLPGFFLSSVFTTFSNLNLDSGVSWIMDFSLQHTNCANYHRLVALKNDYWAGGGGSSKAY